MDLRLKRQEGRTQTVSERAKTILVQKSAQPWTNQT